MLILRLSKREDQALAPLSTILKFSAQDPMSNVLHDTPAIKLHLTMTMIYPFYYISIIPPVLI